MKTLTSFLYSVEIHTYHYLDRIKNIFLIGIYYSSTTKRKRYIYIFKLNFSQNIFQIKCNSNNGIEYVHMLNN